MRRAQAAGAAALAGFGLLCACGPNREPTTDTPAATPASTAPVVTPESLAADLAEAERLPRGATNFKLCRASALDTRDPAPLEVPAGVIFISWGRKAGDERNPLLDADMLKPGAVRYVVVLSRAVTLTRDQPCALTVAQTARSDLFEWRMPLVRKSQDLQFQVTGVENHMAFPLKNRLGDWVKAGLVFGYPTADIGNPRPMKEEG